MSDTFESAQPGDEYPWYKVVTDGSIEQGDVIVNVPHFTLEPSISDYLNDNAKTNIDFYDAIVLSQSCDLVATRPKVEQVIVCPVFELDELRNSILAVKDKGSADNVKKGRIEGLHMLPPSNLEEMPLNGHVANFRQVFTLPFAMLTEIIGMQDPRIRLMPPYREDLAQAFSRFVMRIGYPKDFKV